MRSVTNQPNPQGESPRKTATRLTSGFSCKLNLAVDKQTSKTVSESHQMKNSLSPSLPQTWRSARPSVTCHSLVNSASKPVSHLLRPAENSSSLHTHRPVAAALWETVTLRMNKSHFWLKTVFQKSGDLSDLQSGRWKGGFVKHSASSLRPPRWRGDGCGLHHLFQICSGELHCCFCFLKKHDYASVKALHCTICSQYLISIFMLLNQSWVQVLY